MSNAFTATTAKPKSSALKSHEAKISAYTKNCKGCSGRTKSGKSADWHKNYLAADLRYWKIGQKLRIGSQIWTVEDTGKAIKGQWRFDMLVKDQETAKNFGVRSLVIEYD